MIFTSASLGIGRVNLFMSASRVTYAVLAQDADEVELKEHLLDDDQSTERRTPKLSDEYHAQLRFP